MNILYLGPISPLVRFLEEDGRNAVLRTEDQIPNFGDADFVVSYGYRHIIKNAAEIKRMDGRAVNLHIAYLPWNRGADPNLWSWIENTPQGVTIHYIDSGLDTGDIIARRRVFFDVGQTLASSYAKLHEEMVDLFMEQWHSIKTGTCDRIKQNGGTIHFVRDRSAVQHLLVQGWATPVDNLRPEHRR